MSADILSTVPSSNAYIFPESKLKPSWHLQTVDHGNLGGWQIIEKSAGTSSQNSPDM